MLHKKNLVLMSDILKRKLYWDVVAAIRRISETWEGIQDGKRGEGEE